MILQESKHVALIH